MIQAILNHSRSEGGARLVMIALADRADDSGLCWPSVQDIADRSRLSRSQVFRHLQSLEDLGELRRVKAGGGNGTNTYQIEVDPSHPCDGGGRTHATGTRRTHATGGVASMRPEPSLNRHTSTPVGDLNAQHTVLVVGGMAPSTSPTVRCAIQPTVTRVDQPRRFTAQQTETVDAFIDRLAERYPVLGDGAERRAWASVGYRLFALPRKTANEIVRRLCDEAGKLAARNGHPASLQRLANRLIGGAK